MSVIPYTAIEYDALVEALSKFAVAETSLDISAIENPHDPVNLWIKLNAAVGDLLLFNLMKWVREAIPTEALRVANFDSFAKGVGYKRPRATAAVGDLTITFDLDAVGGGPSTISKDTRFSDGTEVFQFDANVVVGPGAGIVTVTAAASHGASSSQTVATSTGMQGQVYSLAGVPILEDTLVLTVAAVGWTRVEPWELVQATPTAEVFTVLYGNDGTAYVQFGDGLNGEIPPAGAVIAATYKTGGGYAGNVAAARIKQIQTPVTGLLTVNNAAAFSGGNPEQALEQAKAVLPSFMRANDRCVISDDYAAVAVSVGGIAKAAASAGTCGSGCGSSQVVYAIPTGGGSLSITQIRQISNAIRLKRPPNKKVLIRDAVRADLYVEALVTVSSEAKAAEVQSAVTNLLADELDLTSRQFGDLILLQAMYKVVDPSAVRGVDGVLFRTFSVLPYANRYRYGTAGNGTVTNIAYTGDLRREWQIVVTAGGSAITPGSFQVRERYVGTIDSLSSNTLLDEAAEFSANALAAGGWTLVVDPEAGTAAQTISGNSATSITTDGLTDLRDAATTGDDYVVQKTQTNVGKIFSQTVAVAVLAGATTLPLTAGWAIGDRLRVTDGVTTFETTITGGVSGAWIVDVAVPAAGLASVTASAVWVSDDGELTFTVNQGSVVWAPGDELYVDTYERLSDVQMRPLVFPRILAENLIVRTAGGK